MAGNEKKKIFKKRICFSGGRGLFLGRNVHLFFLKKETIFVYFGHDFLREEGYIFVQLIFQFFSLAENAFLHGYVCQAEQSRLQPVKM